MKSRLYPAVAAVICGMDLYLKSRVEKCVKPGEEKKLSGTPFSIRKVYNRGVAYNPAAGSAEDYADADHISGGSSRGV